MMESTEWRAPDLLSPAAAGVLAIGRTIAYTRLTPTSTGTPEARAQLTALRPEQLFTVPARRSDDAAAALSGLWLYHDYLHESHEISQSLHSPAGSFWHAIMHRREGDFSNAKYWYARCRHHPAFGSIAEHGRALLHGLPDARVLQALVQDEWDPDGFVDVVEAIHRKPDDPMYAPAVALQQAEWRGLFEHCVGAAVGAPSSSA